MAQIAIGLVGFYPFLRSYPLGPDMRDGLEALHWPDHRVDIKEMNWGPVAIVQDFQASDITYDRIVLIAAVARGGGRAKGSLSCRHWTGGTLEVLAVQDRVFEAVTGIISLDNLLVIGEYFKIWPKEVIVLEVELPTDHMGDIVLKELGLEQAAGAPASVGQHPLSAQDVILVNEIVALTDVAVGLGQAGLPQITALSVKDLNPLAEICHNQLIEDIRRQTPLHS